MLRRLDTTAAWRSLGQGFWPQGIPLGKKTVIYGHNGSGKSTLAELLLSLAEGSAATDLTWEDENQNPIKISAGNKPPSQSIAVFTRRWVETNLSDFLDGESAAAIVTLGKEAIDAKEEESGLVAEISELHAEIEEAEKDHTATNKKIEKLAREVQDGIVSQLKQFDYSFYTKNRFSVSKVKAELKDYKGAVPNTEECAAALKGLAEGAPPSVSSIASPPTGVADRLAILQDLAAETPIRVAIETLDGNPSAQAWVEQGLALHENINHCLFCGGEFSAYRRKQLALHFDESWLDIRNRAQTLLTAVIAEKQALLAWRSNLPDARDIISALRADYKEAADNVNAAVDTRIAALEALENMLETKVADPSATPREPDWSVLTSAPSTTGLAQVVNKQNEEASQHEAITARRKQIVFDHLIGSQSENFRQIEEQAKELAGKKESANKAKDKAEQRLDQVRQEQFTTKDMANTLTNDLARVYGKGHLTVAVTPDGKSYECRRGNKPSTDLSDGERMILSLLYFLRKLQDKHAPAGDPTQRVVVIDDPSSSLDREALFATHQWLIDSLQHYGQYVVLTHDFGLLRLFLKSQKNAWGSSRKKIKNGNEDEARFPNVSFLEMYATSINGERRSKIEELPKVLLKSTSEYAYLFSAVMSGIAHPEDHERLFLLPNAARRVLEIFASYKSPHRGNFDQQLEVLVQSKEGEPYRDVYDFCNRYSHGEGSESIDVLDARAVSSQIKRCMEFLCAVDTEHFNRMCTATETDASVLL